MIIRISKKLIATCRVHLEVSQLHLETLRMYQSHLDKLSIAELQKERYRLPLSEDSKVLIDAIIAHRERNGLTNMLRGASSQDNQNVAAGSSRVDVTQQMLMNIAMLVSY